MLYVEKRKNKQAGFTLVELIVAIAIMGILLIIALPQVRKIQSANKDRKYEAYQSSIERGAKLYIDSYSKDLFGNNDSGCVRIKYSELKNKNLVKDFSSKDITCAKDEETFVQVRKVRDEYQYASSIVCRDSKRVVYQDGIDTTFSCDNKPDEDSPLIEVSPKESDWTKTKNLKIKIKIADASGLNSNVGITYHFKTSAGTKVGKSYTYAYKNKKGITSVQYQIPTSYLPKDSNQYYLVIEPYVSKTTSGVQDVLGNDVTSPATFGLYKIDNVAPTCGTVTGNSTTWTNKDKTVSVACSDDASGCRQNIFSKPFKTTTTTANITIEDQAGNTNSCSVNVYLDKSKPSIPTSKVRYNDSKGKVITTTASWTAETLWWGEFIANTNGGSSIDRYEYSSGCTKKVTGTLLEAYTYSKTKDATYCIRAVNQAGTASDWSGKYYFKIDKTPPTCGTDNGSKTWTNSNRTVTVNCNDNDQSGCSKSSFSAPFTTDKKTGTIQISDNVGNTRQCPVNVYIDKTPPYTPTLDWTKKSVIEGYTIQSGLYGDCVGTKCDNSGLSTKLQTQKKECYLTRKCNVDPTSKTKETRNCAYQKMYPCGYMDVFFDAGDVAGGSGVKGGIVYSSSVYDDCGFRFAGQKFYVVFARVYYVYDNAGNRSAPLYVWELMNDVFTENLTNRFYYTAGKWKRKSGVSCPTQWPAI